MKRGADRTAKARSALLADHAERCRCQGRDPCVDGDELRRVLMRDVDAQLERASAGLDELARAQVEHALRPALEGLQAFNRALRAELGARGLVKGADVVSLAEAKTKITTRRRRASER